MTVAAEPKTGGHPPAPARGAGALRRPGWWRALLGTLAGLGFGFGLTVALRALQGDSPVVDGDAITTVCLISTPFGFLIGLGAFDYWFRWAAGAPTVPEA